MAYDGRVPPMIGKLKTNFCTCGGLSTKAPARAVSHFTYEALAPPEMKLEWESPPKRVLIVKKPGVPEVNQAAQEVIDWMFTQGLQVVIEPSASDDFPELPIIDPRKDISSAVDFVVCLGGDGTLLHANSLFSGPVPPFIAFNLGTFGFLTPFKIENFKEDITKMINGEYYVTIRPRLHCILYKDGKKSEFQVLNDVVIGRGKVMDMVTVECYINGEYATEVKADGLVISTSSGSTAYNMSAGGGIVHPQVSAMTLTPICPHSLSFRPLLFPASATITIQVPNTPRHGSPNVAFDGRCQQELKEGDRVTIETSCWPVPSVAKYPQLSEWVKNLSDRLHWNR